MPLVEEIILGAVIDAQPASVEPISLGGLSFTSVGIPANEPLINSIVDPPFDIKMSNKTVSEKFAELDIEGFSLYYDGNGFVHSKSPKKYRVIANCCHCAKDIIEDGKTKYFRKGTRDMLGRESFFCESCLPEHTTCSHCGFYFSSKELKMGVCPACIEQAPSRLIKNYSSKAEGKFKKLGTSLDKVYLGVELEYESKDYGLDTLIVDDLIKDFAILKRDSSIKQGFEVVSAPATPDVHREIWDNFLNKLPPTVVVEDTCGMHVHVSRIRMSDLQVAKILQNIYNPQNYKYITAISGRESSYHNDFTKKKTWSDGKQGGRVQKDRDRHTALNCNNPHTIEFRLFRSTKDKGILLKNIEFCYAMTRFAQCSNCSVSESKTFKAFYHYVAEFRKEFPYLWKFMQNSCAFSDLR
jgi:hypothetical protein